jgi:hypothetical protein
VGIRHLMKLERALISPRPPGEPRRVAAPAVPDPFPPGGPAEHRVRELPEVACSAAPFLTLPERKPETRWEDDAAWLQLSYLVRVERDIKWLQDPMRDDRSPDPWSISHVLGEPTSAQDDVRIDAAHRHIDPELRDPSAWEVLVGLHSGSHLSILDAGAHTVLVPRQDLAAARWDRAILTSSSA